MAMTSMKRTPKDRSTIVAEAKCCEEEVFPYGLRFNLGDEELDKLGLDVLPAVGKELRIEAVVMVKDASVRDDGEGKRKSLGLQIIKLDLGDTGEESTDKILGG